MKIVDDAKKSIYEHLDNNINNINYNKILNIIEKLLKSHHQAYLFLEDVYLSLKSCNEEETNEKCKHFKYFYNIRVSNKKREFFIADILNDSQKINLLKLSIEKGCKTNAHPLCYHLLPTKFKHNPELIFLVVKYYGYYTYDNVNIDVKQEEILKNYLIDKIECSKEAKICTERFFSFCNISEAIINYSMMIILDFYGIDKSNEYSIMLDSISK
jgi:hypothetical protein